jgi:pyridoxal phosphate enzyme (YggS family)
MAVTKTFARTEVETALAAGLDLFGENRVQEAQEKFIGLAGSFTLHLIGHLQRNKARTAASLFQCVQSIDKAETAEALSRQCVSLGRPMDVLLEYNASGEESKSGFRSRDELLRGLDAVGRLPALRVRGLMTVGPLTADRDRVRGAFSLLAGFFRDIRESRPDAFFDVLSMGMSGDFEIAVEEGSTMVRLGTALFGQRGVRA